MSSNCCNPQKKFTMSAKIECECGSFITRDNVSSKDGGRAMRRHLNSTKHKLIMETGVWKQERKSKEKYTCGCGSIVTNKSMHLASQKHINWTRDGVSLPTGRRIAHTVKRAKRNIQSAKERQNKKITCECGCVVSVVNLPAHKRSSKHLLLMKGEKVKYAPRGEYKTQYTREERIQRRIDWEKKKIKCECGGEFTQMNKQQHLRTKKHLRLIEPKWITIVVKKKRNRLTIP